MKKMKTDLTFEDALARLENIVRELEKGETALDESVKLFEEGIKLSEICSKYLKDAQQKVEILIDNGADEPQITEFKENE